MDEERLRLSWAVSPVGGELLRKFRLVARGPHGWVLDHSYSAVALYDNDLFWTVWGNAARGHAADGMDFVEFDDLNAAMRHCEAHAIAALASTSTPTCD